MVTTDYRESRATERAHCIEHLREMLQEGDRVGTVVVYKRGQTDYVECFLPGSYQGRPTVERVTYWVARAIDYWGSLEKGIPRRGYGYDKAHDVVYALSLVLFGDGKGNALVCARLLTVKGH
jgi:hypothetical protein